MSSINSVVPVLLKIRSLLCSSLAYEYSTDHSEHNLISIAQALWFHFSHCCLLLGFWNFTLYWIFMLLPHVELFFLNSIFFNIPRLEPKTDWKNESVHHFSLKESSTGVIILLHPTRGCDFWLLTSDQGGKNKTIPTWEIGNEFWKWRQDSMSTQQHFLPVNELYCIYTSICLRSNNIQTCPLVKPYGPLVWEKCMSLTTVICLACC